MPAGRRDRRRRLRYIEGQIRGLQRMVAEQAPCVDILTQTSAVDRALRSVALDLITQHLEAAATVTPDSPEDGTLRTAEAAAAVVRLVRS